MIDVVMGDEDRPDCAQLESRQRNLPLDSGAGIDEIGDSVDDEGFPGSARAGYARGPPSVPRRMMRVTPAGAQTEMCGTAARAIAAIPAASGELIRMMAPRGEPRRAYRCAQ